MTTLAPLRFNYGVKEEVMAHERVHEDRMHAYIRGRTDAIDIFTDGLRDFTLPMSTYPTPAMALGAPELREVLEGLIDDYEDLIVSPANAAEVAHSGGRAYENASMQAAKPWIDAINAKLRSCVP
jgi:hypothetical protein